MQEWINNIWNHPTTSIAGVLIAVATIAGVLSQQGVTLGTAGTGTIVSLIAGLATALLGLLSKDPSTKEQSGGTLKPLFVLVALALFGTMAQAQLTPTISATADAVHYRGNWYAGNTETALVDIKDTTASTTGYVDSLFVGGNFRLYNAAGFNSYEGTVAYVPTKALAAFLAKVAPNVSADYVHILLHGDVGDTVPTKGSPFITGGGGAEVGVNLNTSGTAEWKIVRAGWQNPGVWYVDTGITYTFLNGANASTVQSSKLAKLRRALRSKLARPVAE